MKKRPKTAPRPKSPPEDEHERAFRQLKQTMDAGSVLFQPVYRTKAGWTSRRSPPSYLGLERFTAEFKVPPTLINSLNRLGFLGRNFLDPKGLGSWKEAEKVRRKEGLPKLSVWVNERGLEACFWCDFISAAPEGLNSTSN